MIVCTHPAGPEIADTWFCKALRWRLFDPDEALGIAATHRRRAAEARLRHPGSEAQAARHDQMAAICECHAATLRDAAATAGSRP